VSGGAEGISSSAAGKLADTAADLHQTRAR
jgi:hypothetical protein